jgi:hypothetical protein
MTQRTYEAVVSIGALFGNAIDGWPVTACASCGERLAQCRLVGVMLGVWSVRAMRSPARSVEALRRQRQEAADKLAAGERWQETGLVFTTASGTGRDAANVRRCFRRALA